MMYTYGWAEPKIKGWEQFESKPSYEYANAWLKAKEQ